MLSIGGFYPGFRPEPAQIPPMRRIGYHLDSPVPGLRLRAEGYFAVTSNTVQLGGYFEAGIEAAGCSAKGFLGVDAIVQFSPFRVHAEIRAGLRVRALGVTLCGVSFSGRLDAPGPVVISGRMRIETPVKDFPFDETFTIGTAHPLPPVPGGRLARILADDCFGPTSLRAVGDADPAVSPAELPVPPGFALVRPLGGLEWTQQRAPLDIPVDRLDGAPLGSVQHVKATAVGKVADTRDLFAPGSFITLNGTCLLYTSPSPRDLSTSRMPSSA